MPTTITTTLILNDDDPPAATITVQLDGVTLASRAVTPVEAVAALAVLAPEAGGVWAPAQALVDRLAGDVDRATKAQTIRKSVLSEWRTALSAAPAQ